MAYKIMNGSVPFYLSDLLMRRSSIHCFNTRNRQDLSEQALHDNARLGIELQSYGTQYQVKLKTTPHINSLNDQLKTGF